MRRSFRDPVTGVLKAHGYADTNAPGDLVRDEPDGFALHPGRWRWDGADWVSVPPPPSDAALEAEFDGAVRAAALVHLDFLNEVRARTGQAPVTEEALRMAYLAKRKGDQVAQTVGIRFGQPEPK